MRRANAKPPSLAKVARDSMTERGLATFWTIASDNGRYGGIVTRTTPALVMFREERDLAFDGMQIWPRRSVAESRRNELERAQDAVLRHLRIEAPAPPRWLAKVDTLGDLFREMMERDVWTVVEQMKEYDGTALYVGKIVGTGRNWFDVLPYDAEGTWEPVTRLSFAAVLRVEFGDTYSERFSAYMRAKNPPPAEAERGCVDCRPAKR